jgi:hypothetical protein
VIRAETKPAASAFVARLASKGRAIAAARLEEERRAAAQDPWRWRAARLLWPLMGVR